MQRKQCRLLLMFAVAGWCAIHAAITAAQEARYHIISVGGRGKVKVAPTSVELLGTISCEAELAGDALTKFRSTKEAAVNAIKKLELKNVTVETGSFGIGPVLVTDSASAFIARSRQAAPEPPKVQIQESFRIRLGQIDKLDRESLTETIAKLIDTAKESGVSFGPPPGASRVSITREENQGFTTFIVDDPQAVREQAEAQAMLEAKAQAERLAKLSGGRLGEIVSVSETGGGYVPSSLRPIIPGQSPKLDEIEFTASLQIQFRLIGQPSESK